MDRIHFKINDAHHSVGPEVSSELTLLDYIRNVAELRGTKYMCREGGCGACIVSAAKTPGAVPQSVNSCLVSITSCEDWDITTIEKVGNKLQGYNILQTTLAENNGTQCGYCTPGWIMAMYSLLHNKTNITKLEIERSFGSNICRCTGYRPILEAFKKFAIDDPNPKKLLDIEDLDISHKCAKNCSKDNCDVYDWCFVSKHDLDTKIIEIHLKDGKKWFKVFTVEDIFKILYEESDSSYMLVAGNTAKGAYPINEYPDILIDISDISELKGSYVDQNLVIGAGTTLTEIMNIFQVMSQQEYFRYLMEFYDHLSLVAHIPVRNIGTIAGNLMIKHQHNEFPSDVFLLLETVGAQLTIQFSHGPRIYVTMQQFLKTDMRGAVILNVMLPPLNARYNVVTYKIMPRAQNAHAIVNAGFLYKLNANNTVQESRIVYGGLSPLFVRAKATEAFLIGKQLFSNETLQLAIGMLERELVVTENPPEPSVEYRRHLAVNLFYKGLLSLCPENIMPLCFRSGAVKIKQARPVSKAEQVFETNPSLWPLNKPIPKVEALIQCSGEASFTEDLPTLPREVFAEFVLSTIPKGNIIAIDPSKALLQPGVIAFYTAADIPGLNSFTPADSTQNITNEEVLSSGVIEYFNQPLAIIVAETRRIAERAAKMVHVEYANVKTPLIDVKKTKRDPSKAFFYYASKAKNKGTDVAQVIKDETTIYGQYHFVMETLVCVSKPVEDGLEVWPASQWMDCVHLMISRALNLEQNRIDVNIRRLGGAYGIKVSRTTQVAVACSLVTQKLNRPCRFIQPLTTNMRAVGKRFPCSTDYEIGVNISGDIQYLNMDLYEDNGYLVNEVLAMLAVPSYYNCYDNSRWNYNLYNAITDTAKNTWCRSPATLENIAAAETFMERISYALSLDPIETRLANLDNAKYSDIKEMVASLKTKADYNNRRATVERFNRDNRWKKRGLRTAFLRWTPMGTTYYDVTMSVYHGDGTVAITHAGIEMGQGVNTKAVQIAAYFLNIPIDKIQIKPNNTMITPNSFISASSFTSQFVGIGVQKCCEELLRRLTPIREQLKNATWEQIIQRAFDNGIDLQTHGFVGANDIAQYDIFGVTFAEVEIDLLTGETEVLKVDLIQDVGVSVSPEIDVGQIEGAFIMGLGYWTSEQLVYNEGTGELLTDRTWNYYVPQARDIPQDFSVYFRKKSYSVPNVLGAKTTGEPSICMSIAVPFAIREAIAAARFESGIPKTDWFELDGPYTVEKICLAAENNTLDYKFY